MQQYMSEMMLLEIRAKKNQRYNYITLVENSSVILTEKQWIANYLASQ